MARNRLDRYFWEAQAHANELLDLMDVGVRDALLEPVSENWTEILRLIYDAPEPALIFLGETPSQRERRMKRMSEEDFRLLWVQARFLALEATNALETAAKIDALPLKGCRDAVRKIAQVTFRLPVSPDARQTLHLRLDE